MARSQGARLFELRAAIALNEQQGGREQLKLHKALLGAVYDGFTEGFGTLDLVEAKALLNSSTPTG